MSQTNKEKRPSTPRVIALEWMRQAVEDGDPDGGHGNGLAVCWQCGQWRPEKFGNENEQCPHCGAVWLAF